MTAENLGHEDSKVTALVILAQQGDSSAFAELFEIFGPCIAAVAKRKLGGRFDVADVVQEVFLRVFTKIGQLRDPRCFPGWLRQMTARTALSVLRGKKELNGGGDAGDLLIQIAGRAADSAEDDLNGSEQRELLHAALAKLGAPDREVLVAHYLSGKRVKSIAVEFGVPLGTIKRRLHTARLRLADLMGAV